MFQFVSFHRHELLEVLNNYQEYLKQFKEEICKDLTFNLREGSDHDTEVQSIPFLVYPNGRHNRVTQQGAGNGVLVG